MMKYDFFFIGSFYRYKDYCFQCPSLVMSEIALSFFKETMFFKIVFDIFKKYNYREILVGNYILSLDVSILRYLKK